MTVDYMWFLMLLPENNHPKIFSFFEGVPPGGNLPPVAGKARQAGDDL
jgi:hypothetical protein